MRTKSITTKLLLMTVSLALVLAACKKDRQVETTVQAGKPKKNWDETAKAVAADVSKKLNSLSFCKMLKHEVLLRFDGDANILLSSIVKRLPKYLAYEASRNNAAARITNADLLANYSFDIIAEAAQDYPQMQLAVQTDAESWDPNTFTPSVVYEPTDFDEATSTTVPGFDPYQNPITVSSTEEPTFNYVVISQNERTTIRDIDPTLSYNEEVRLTSSNCLVSQLVYEASYNPEAVSQMLVPLCDDGGGGTGGGGTGGGGSSSYAQYNGTGQDGILPTLIDRQMGTIVSPPTDGSFNRLAPTGTFNGTTVYRKDFKHEKMRFIRCDRLKDIESWFKGAPEIRMHVFEQNVLNPSESLQIFKEEFKPDKRKDIDGKLWDARGVTMHLWDYQGTGTKASFGYYEYDPVILPNETLAQIGGIVVDILAIATSVDSAGLRLIYGNIRNSVVTGIRSLKQKNGVSEYIGKDDYSIFNDEDQFNHNTGLIQFQTWPDL